MAYFYHSPKVSSLPFYSNSPNLPYKQVYTHLISVTTDDFSYSEISHKWIIK